jgi:transcriptional regulator with XRE-family HTH domain
MAQIFARQQLFGQEKYFVAANTHMEMVYLFEPNGPARYTAAVRRFGENLKAARKRMKVTQEQLAERLGYANNSTLSNWERGDLLPEPDTIEKVAGALGVEPRELLQDVVTPYDRLRGADPIRHPLDQTSDLSPRRSDVPAHPTPSRLQQQHADLLAATERLLGDIVETLGKQGIEINVAFSRDHAAPRKSKSGVRQRPRKAG